MKNIKIIFTLIAFFAMTMSSVQAGTFNANAKTKRIPAGTTFQLQFLQTVGTFSGAQGDAFVAKLKNEQSGGANVILPVGTVVRGSIGDLKTAKRFSRGAKLYLDFDHVVTPTGRQVPIDIAISQYDYIYYDGGLYKNLGYGEAVKKNYQKGIDMTKAATKYGLKAGESAPGIQYMTAPLCAIGGFVGGVGYFVGNSVADMFRKGKDIQITEGEILNAKLINPIDIPVY